MMKKLAEVVTVAACLGLAACSASGGSSASSAQQNPAGAGSSGAIEKAQTTPLTATQTAGQCQTIGFNIVGGEVCSATSWVAQRTLFLYDKDGAEMCSGTRIGPNTMVTAGHCVLDDLTGVQIGYMGAPDPAPVATAGAGVFRAPVDHSLVIQAFARPATFNVLQSDGDTSDADDISLIFFSGTLDEGKLATTTIAAANDFPTSTAALASGSAQLVTAGFGTIAENDTRNDAALRAVAVNIDAVDATAKTITFKPGENKGTCGGDSGGPAFVLTEKNYPKLVGVTSRSPDNQADNVDGCLSGNGIDVDARYYEAWMQCVSNTLLSNSRLLGLGLQGLQLGVTPQATCAADTTVVGFVGATTATTATSNGTPAQVPGVAQVPTKS